MLSVFEFLLIGLASFRLTRLLVADYIFEWLRKPFMETKIVKNEEGIEEEWIEPKGFIGEGLSCQWCVGVWSSLLMLLFYMIVPYGEWLIWLLAVAGIQSMLYLWTDRL
ncbi:DUF1360 domain-containing protein [Halobacillus sp. ACCC02827]|uniref:DUF1360 domain-containing protein n=1 Tax=Bacillaceae TaxID=186817 RepID=UPI0002A50879|nr:MULTISPECIES: DUF1360 domain-containing protein [Bacillaceae]ELK45182.1 hypothetical protein D479_15672 [Halobacillus sp. BAB-2008]QHT46065.1 DUF1360 domain-containing protein [Bacillus sp. SB49]WJE16876.1 DUF1360 domain-containing protein [Halobacillus sp. ACCC02827]